jgi:acetolactate synthase-1/2/3 large subunit
LPSRPLPPNPEHDRWLAWCRQRLIDYPVVLPKHREFNGRINPYHFIEALFDRLAEDDIVACGNATATIVPFQAAAMKHGQRLFSNSGSASMGYDLPAAIGAWFGALAARGSQRRIICLAGDGSIMMNLQELQTIAQHRLPIKIFVLDNRGYLSIRTSQANFFGRLAGADPDSGVTLPDFVAVATAFRHQCLAARLRRLRAAPARHARDGRAASVPGRAGRNAAVRAAHQLASAA